MHPNDFYKIRGLDSLKSACICARLASTIATTVDEPTEADCETFALASTSVCSHLVDFMQKNPLLSKTFFDD